MRRMGGAHRSGLTLLELILAVGIMVVAVLGLLSALLSSSSLNSLSREKTQATATVMSKLEELLTSSWADLTTRDGESFDVLVETASGSIALKPGTGLTTVGTVSIATTTTDLILIEVTATWQSSVGNDLELVMRSLIANH